MNNRRAYAPFRFPRVVVQTLLILIAFFAFTQSGCATLLGTMRFNAADLRFELDRPSGPTLSANTSQILRENALNAPSSVDDLAKLRALVDMATTSDLVYAYAETAYLQARKLEKSSPLQAQRLYADVVLFSWHYLFNPSLSNAHDRATWNGQLSDVVLLYNGACERFLHLALAGAFQKDDARFPFQNEETSEVVTGSGRLLVRLHIEPGGWKPDEYGDFRVAADCDVKELGFDCRQSGFGVPLVVERRAGDQTRRIEEKYYPPSILFPATAILRPNPAYRLGTLPPLDENVPADSNVFDFSIDVYDPLSTSDLVQNGNAFPLETDLTTPLAYFLTTHDKLASRVARKSLLNPEALQRTVAVAKTDEERQLQGLYLLEPYDPNKIPVIMTHGLASSPVTWMEMYNALRSIKGFQTGYQFMFFFYPTGQPFWASAATLRHELRAMRETVDPERRAPALDDAVLVGHSMGGLVSRMQVQSSGDRVWSVVSSQPVDSFNFDDDARQKIQDWFFFEPNPSIKRVITIATPFHGSKFANTFTNWLAERAITVPQTVASVLSSAANLSTSFKKKKNADFDSTLLTISTSVESLDPKCPIFKVLDDLPIPPDVALDNIVGVLPELKNRIVNPKKSDGVVDFSSAHRDDVELESETPAPHTVVHAHFDTINQVKTILSQHLALYAASRDQARPAHSVYAPPTPANATASPTANELPAEFYASGEAPVNNAATQETSRAYGPQLPAEFYTPVDTPTPEQAPSPTTAGPRLPF